METGRLTFHVAAVQMEPKLGRLDSNLEQILNWLEPAAMGQAMLVAACLGIAGSVIPARNASRLNVVDAVRRVA